MAASASGDVVLLAVILGLAAADILAGTAAVLAALAVVVRWGSTSLSALAGGQAVLGSGGWTGSAPMVASSWLAATALVLASPPRWWAACAFGAAAAAVVAGPSAASGSVVSAAVGLRVAASVMAAAIAVLAGRWVPRRTCVSAAALAGMLALVVSLF